MTARLPRRALLLAATAALTIIAAIGAALVIFAFPHVSARATHMVFATPVEPPPQRVMIVLARGVPLPAPRSGVEATGSGVDIHTVGSILLIVGIAGIILSLLFLFWSSRTRPGHWPRSA